VKRPFFDRSTPSEWRGAKGLTIRKNYGGHSSKKIKEAVMIKGIVGYKVRKDKDLQPMLLKLRSHAMQYPGFVSAETLVSEKDFSVVAMTSTWETIESWRIWQESTITQELLRQDGALLMEEPRVTTYRMITPQVRWI